MKFYILLFATLSLTILCHAQSPDLLESQGKIPKEFTTSSTTKYKKQLSSLEKSTKRKGKKNKKEKKHKQQFLLESNFEIDNILQSGLVMFNDPATVYVNKVLQKIPSKKSKKRDRGKPRAYVLNSPAVNAFATDQGIIFVTLGLLANLENEAQLAFILCHELIHIYHNHSIDKFVHSKNVERGEKSFDFSNNKDNLTINQKLFNQRLYSRNIEEEADEEGFEIFKKTNYDPATIPDVFRILYYSYLPFDDQPFKKSFFEDENYILPNDLWLQQVNPIKEMLHKEDETSSHPASAKRLKKIQESLENNSSEGKKLFIVGKEEFNKVQQKAKYQIPFLNLYNENYPEAIYTSSLLLNENNDDINLKKVIGKSLYMYAKYLNFAEKNDNSSSDEYKEFVKEIQGESQRVYHLLAEADHKEAAVLALRYNWDLHLKSPKDTEIQKVVDDLFIEFVSIFKDLDDFSKTKPTKKEASEELVDSENDTRSKNEKIKSISSSKKYWKYAFVDHLSEEKFKKAFSKGKKAYKKRQRTIDSYATTAGKKKYRKEFNKEQKKGKALGIKKVVVVNPYYLSVSEDRSYNTKVEYIRSEEKQDKFNMHLATVGKKSKLNVEVLDMNNLRSSDIEKFNDIATANRYFTQQMDQYDLSLTPGHQQAEMDQLAKKYKTDYFLWTGVISLKENNKGEWLWVGASLFMPYFLPFTFYNAVTPDYDMFYYAILYDVTSGKRSIIKMDLYDTRDGNNFLKSHIYDTYHQINSKAK